MHYLAYRSKLLSFLPCVVFSLIHNIIANPEKRLKNVILILNFIDGLQNIDHPEILLQEVLL